MIARSFRNVKWLASNRRFATRPATAAPSRRSGTSAQVVTHARHFRLARPIGESSIARLATARGNNAFRGAISRSVRREWSGNICYLAPGTADSAVFASSWPVEPPHRGPTRRLLAAASGRPEEALGGGGQGAELV